MRCVPAMYTPMELRIAITLLLLYTMPGYADDSFVDPRKQVGCDEDYEPRNCGFPRIQLSKMTTVEDFDRCAPAVLPHTIRNYYWGGAGRKVTYQRNLDAFKKIAISQHVLRDVSQWTTSTTVLNKDISFPLGVSPVAMQKHAHAEGELATVRAVAAAGNVVILSSWATSTIEEMVMAGRSVTDDFHFWMQTYIFKDRFVTLDIVRKAENAGARAIVVTCDSPVYANFSCGSVSFSEGLKIITADDIPDPSTTFQDITWLKQFTNLPIVAKGITRVDDAIRVAAAGASAVFVSTHGGRQMDTSPASIDVLPRIATALRQRFPNVEVYMDGGVRNGWDIFKVLALGARAAFIGRPVVWGLALGGEDGVKRVLRILKEEFEQVMILAGYKSPAEITGDAVMYETCSYSDAGPRYIEM